MQGPSQSLFSLSRSSRQGQRRNLQLYVSEALQAYFLLVVEGLFDVMDLLLHCCLRWINVGFVRNSEISYCKTQMVEQVEFCRNRD